MQAPLGDDILFRPGQAGFDERIGGFNTAFAHEPEFVVTPRDEREVSDAVRFAAAAGMPVTVQSTGHGILDAMVGGMLLNLRELNTVAVDPAARTATVGGGARWRDVIAVAAEHGLGGLCGSTSDVGVVGYLLGGGLPVLGRAFGYAADGLVSARLITADGEAHTVDAAHDADLYWALRGGGRGLGVVTEATVRLHELAHIAGGGLIFDGADAEAVLAAYARWTESIPDELCTSLAFLRLPPFPEVPELLRGRFVLHLRVTHPDAAADLASLLAPMRDCAPVLLDTIGTLPYAALDGIHQDPDQPSPAFDRGAVLTGLGPDAQRELIAQLGPASASPLLMAELRHLGARLAVAPDGGDAIGARDGAFSLYAVGMLAGPAADRIGEALAALFAALAPHSQATSIVNLLGCATTAEERRAAWDPERRARLDRVRESVGADALFR